MTEQFAERQPIGWWLKTADAQIEQAFEDVFEGRSITRREWQVLEPVSRARVPESELLQKLEAFADIVAGSGESFSNNCGSVGSTPQLSFFTFKPQLVRPGGFLTCGYAQSSMAPRTARPAMDRWVHPRTPM